MPREDGDVQTAQGVDAETALFFFENSLDLLTVIDEARFAAVNAAWQTVTGWPVEALCGRAVLDFVHPEDHESLRAQGRGAREVGEAEAELRFRTASGDWIWLRSRAQVGPDGRLSAVIRDITRERLHETEMRDAARAREQLREAAGVGGWRFHPVEGWSWSPELAALSPHLAGLQSEAEFDAQVHPDDRAPVRAAIERAVTSGEPTTMDVRFAGPDGGWRYFRNHIHPAPLAGGGHELHGIAQDVTELAQARDEARRGERRARHLVESAPFAVAVFDRSLRYAMVSPMWVELFEARPDLVGRELDPVRTPSQFFQALERALDGVSTEPSNFRYTDTHGRRRALRWTVQPHLEGSGRVIGAVVYVDDISAFQNARREAEASARRLKLALSAAEAGAIEIDYARGVVWSSPEFDRIVGRSMTYEDVTRTLWPIIDIEDTASVEALRSWWMDGAQGALDLQVTLESRERRWVRMFFEIQHGGDGVIRRLSGLVLDVDAAKRQELALVEAERRAQAAGEAKAQFLANMSHEIRTPMNGVLGVLHLLQREALTDEGRILLDEAAGCGRMLTELLNDVIDFSRIEAGRLVIHPEPTDVAALAAGVARLLRPQADDKGLALTVEAPGALWVQVDPVRVRQALFNLLGNAVKFTSSGSVVVRVATVEPGRLRLEVEDTGPGISAEDQGKLFARFQQVDGSTTRRFGGSGLGLAITQKLAELMDGTVGLRSEPGVGSCFHLDIAAPAALAVVAAECASENALDGVRVLLVEDNATNRLVIGKLLESLGAVVSTADDGLAGVQAAARGGVDLILMDVQMPVMDGLEAVRRIRALDGPEATVPVIALTANVLAHQHEQYLAAGMDGVVGKPVSPAVLLTEIARLCAGEVAQAA